MDRITLVHSSRNREIAEETDRFFVASFNPFYLGIMVKPSAAIWTVMKSASEVTLRADRDLMEFEIAYRIEVGENTVFFIKPAAGYEEKASSLFG